ncbi:hypothetical protein SFUMM280S_07268 [Streptomyces fumanus]
MARSQRTQWFTARSAHSTPAPSSASAIPIRQAPRRSGRHWSTATRPPSNASAVRRRATNVRSYAGATRLLRAARAAALGTG